MSDFFDIFSSCCSERKPRKVSSTPVVEKNASPFKEVPVINQLYSQSMKDLIGEIIFNLHSFSTPSNSPKNSPRDPKKDQDKKSILVL